MAAPDLAILLVHTGQSSSLIGQNAEADTVPARLPEIKYRDEIVYYSILLFIFSQVSILDHPLQTSS